jgi:uncharacterized protein
MGTILRYLVAFGIFWFIIHLLRTRLAPPRPAQPRPAPRDVRMVRCAHCGVHVPEPEAIRSGGNDYCSAAHRSLGPRGY